MVPLGFAQATPTDGQLATSLAQQLVCDTHNVISGNLGLMMGFLVACWGLYLMIVKNSMKSGLMFLIFGALLTALPGIVLSFFDGLGLALGGMTEVHSITRPGCL